MSKRPPDVPPSFNVTALRRMSLNTKLGTELGVLEVRGDLTQLEADVGRRIGEIYRNHDKAIGAKRTPKAPSYEIGPDLTPRLAKTEDEALRAVVKASDDFDALQRLLRRYGTNARDAVVRLCVDDHALPSYMLPAVRRALRALAKPLLGRHTSR